MPRYAFDEFVLDVDEHRLLRDGVEVRLRGKVFEVLCALVQSEGKLLRKQDLLRQVWTDAVVEENNLDACVSQLRKALGGGPEKFIQTVHRQGYRFQCLVREIGTSAKPTEQKTSGTSEVPEQDIRTFRTSDGMNIAYSQSGHGPPLVKAANWLNHLEYEWQSPIWTHWVSELTKHHTLLRFDERGNGLSDWNVKDHSFESWVRDLEELIETVKLEKFPIFGISQGGAVAIAYAVRHPERVSKLVLYGAFSRGTLVRNSPAEVERYKALLTLVKLGWGKSNPAFRQMWTTIFMPKATPEQAEWFNELQRITTSPENAVRIMNEIVSINVLDLLPKVKCPTLILHCNRDAVIPVAEGRLLAARIPNSKFVELQSRNHLVIPPEPAWNQFLEELGRFMEWK